VVVAIHDGENHKIHEDEANEMSSLWKICGSTEADHVMLIQHTEVQLLSQGKVLCCFYKLKEMLAFWLQGLRTL